MRSLRVNFTLIALGLVWALPSVLAHGEDIHNGTTQVEMTMGHSQGHGSHDGSSRPMMMKDMEDFPSHPTYFMHEEHGGLMYAHIGIMLLAWVIAMPLTVMLSIGRSRFTFAFEGLFLILNTLGCIVSLAYRAQVPDLYESNAHHSLGWVVTWLAGVWSAVGLIHLYTRRGPDEARPQGQSMSQNALAKHQHFNPATQVRAHRWSHDSGQGSESNINSLSQSSRTSSWNNDSLGEPTKDRESDDDSEDLDPDIDKTGFLQDTKVDRFLSRTTSRFTGRTAAVVNLCHVVLERSMIPLGFISIITGIVTYSGIGMGNHIFNVLAHLIKGGIFFWYGLLTFGRWMGCFSDLGWAWNLKPGPELVGPRKARFPSAEFVESFVIFFYGATNVFMEHLGAWGKAWTAMDLEHVSITIMFFGGGLLGMLVESRRVRKLLTTAMNCSSDYRLVSQPKWSQPRSYQHPLNPIPSLVILLLGIMMSNHTQHSLVAGQVHRQWGLLFACFALARAFTYITFWLKPPETYLPARPPTELLASFCLVSGGMIFMASNKDTINALEEYDLDSMFVFTVMMGLTCLVMAWTLITVAVEGWAIRDRQRQKT